MDVYRRWVLDWNRNDKSDDLIKYMDITKSLSENKVITGLKEYMKKIVMPSLSATDEENVEAVLEKLDDKYKKNKYEYFEDFIDMMEDFTVKEGDDPQMIWEKFIQVMENMKLLKLQMNLDYFFLTLFLKKGKRAKMLSSYEENTLRNILGGEEENQPDEILKNFGKEFTKLKIQNHRTFDFEKQVPEDTENVLVSLFITMSEADHSLEVQGLYDLRVIQDFSDKQDLNPGTMRDPTREVDPIRGIRGSLEHLTGTIKMMTRSLRRKVRRS